MNSKLEVLIPWSVLIIQLKLSSFFVLYVLLGLILVSFFCDLQLSELKMRFENSISGFLGTKTIVNIETMIPRMSTQVCCSAFLFPSLKYTTNN